MIQGLHLKASETMIFDLMLGLHPELNTVLQTARDRVGPHKIRREISKSQSAVMYHLVGQLAEAEKPMILEVGTALGWSAAIMAQACPSAWIKTLNIREDESEVARQALSVFPNVTVTCANSHELGHTYDGPQFHFMFIDGDHALVRNDFVWFEHLLPGGLVLFHDYSPAGSWRQCPPVYDALNDLRQFMGRDFDVLIVDDDRVGMAGFIKQEGETWQSMQP